VFSRFTESSGIVWGYWEYFPVWSLLAATVPPLLAGSRFPVDTLWTAAALVAGYAASCFVFIGFQRSREGVRLSAARRTFGCLGADLLLFTSEGVVQLFYCFPAATAAAFFRS